MIRILVAESYPYIRQGLKRILSDAPEMFVAGEVSNCQKMINMLNRDEYDVLILDVLVGEQGLVDLIKEVKSKRPELSILVLNNHPDEHYAKYVIGAGASKYMQKNSAPEKLIKTIQSLWKNV